MMLTLVILSGMLVDHFGPDANISTTIGWIIRLEGTDIHFSLRMNSNDFDDP